MIQTQHISPSRTFPSSLGCINTGTTFNILQPLRTPCKNKLNAAMNINNLSADTEGCPQGQQLPDQEWRSQDDPQCGPGDALHQRLLLRPPLGLQGTPRH